MIRPLCLAVLILAVLSGCDPSYSDVRAVPALPGSRASPLLVTPRIRDPSFPPTYNPADGWESTPYVDSLTAATYGVPMLGHQRHSIRDTVSLADIASFLDTLLGKRGFQRSPEPASWTIPFHRFYLGGNGRKPQVAAWVRNAPAEGRMDRTVVVVAYATPWPPGQDDTRTTFYVAFLGRGTVPAGGYARPLPQ